MAHLVDSVDIAASPDKLYSMVSDLPRMGEWSPENRGARWVGTLKRPAVGAKFVGKNQVKKLVWFTQGRVITAQPGQAFRFEVRVGPVPVALWEYSFETTPNGARVTEAWTERRPRLVAKMIDRIFGEPRTISNRRGMRKTLDNLKKAAEAS